MDNLTVGPVAEILEQPPTAEIEATLEQARATHGARVCIICGHAPAKLAGFKEGVGVVIWFQIRTWRGEVCRECGRSIFRDYQNGTLMKGWWGFIAFFANLLWIVWNLVSFWRVRRLSQPMPTSASAVTPSPAPLAPGAPLLRRPGIYIAAATLAVLSAIGATGDPASSPNRGPAHVDERAMRDAVDEIRLKEALKVDLAGLTVRAPSGLRLDAEDSGPLNARAASRALWDTDGPTSDARMLRGHRRWYVPSSSSGPAILVYAAVFQFRDEIPPSVLPPDDAETFTHRGGTGYQYTEVIDGTPIESFGTHLRFISTHSSLIVVLEVMGPVASQERLSSLTRRQIERIAQSGTGFQPYD